MLEALDHADAHEAAAALAELDPAAYRPFNLILADNAEAWWIRHSGPRIEAAPVPAGLSMLTAHDLNDAAGSRRIAHFLPRFRAGPPPDPARGDWQAWQALLASRDFAPGGGPHDAMTIIGENGFGTLSSALIALPAPGAELEPVFLFAAGRPDQMPYLPVALSEQAPTSH